LDAEGGSLRGSKTIISGEPGDGIASALFCSSDSGLIGNLAADSGSGGEFSGEDGIDGAGRLGSISTASARTSRRLDMPVTAVIRGVVRCDTCAELSSMTSESLTLMELFSSGPLLLIQLDTNDSGTAGPIRLAICLRYVLGGLIRSSSAEFMRTSAPLEEPEG
jgi:hypothetical protein